MNHETLEAAFKEFWEATYPGVKDAAIHTAIREAFLSGAGHIAIMVANVGYERGLLVVKSMVEQRRREMDFIVNADREAAQRLVSRVPDVPGSKRPGNA